MNKLLFLILLLCQYALSAQILRVEDGISWSKNNKENKTFFTAIDETLRLQDYAMEFFTKNKIVPAEINSTIILTLEIDGNGIPELKKSVCADSKLDLSLLKLNEFVHKMHTWIAARKDEIEILSTVLISIKMDDKGFGVRIFKL